MCLIFASVQAKLCLWNCLWTFSEHGVNPPLVVGEYAADIWSSTVGIRDLETKVLDVVCLQLMFDTGKY